VATKEARLVAVPLRAHKPNHQPTNLTTNMNLKSILTTFAALVATATFSLAEHPEHKTGKFEGAKANTGYATHSTHDGKSVLKVSSDFVIPDTPAPSWQVVDSKGNTYLLNQMKIKGGANRQVTVPAYVHDIAKVQVWCSFAEVLLGEAKFEKPVK
jgi:hypothetical protein